MIRLAVVHTRVGPQEGPGLDESLQSTNIEKEHEYVGEEIYETILPYGGGGEDREQDVPGIRRRPKKKAARGSRVAIDFDGTITLDPRFFKGLVNSIRTAGGRAYLVTGRSVLDKEYVEKFISRYGIKFHEKYFYPIQYRFDWIAWDILRDARIGAWKAKVLSELGIDAVIDDNPIYINQIIKKLPNILVLRPIGGE